MGVPSCAWHMHGQQKLWRMTTFLCLRAAAAAAAPNNTHSVLCRDEAQKLWAERAALEAVGLKVVCVVHEWIPLEVRSSKASVATGFFDVLVARPGDRPSQAEGVTALPDNSLTLSPLLPPVCLSLLACLTRSRRLSQRTGRARSTMTQTRPSTRCD